MRDSRRSSTERTDGTVQVTYNGRLLYRYTGDEQPGVVNGHDMRNSEPNGMAPEGEAAEGEGKFNRSGAARPANRPLSRSIGTKRSCSRSQTARPGRSEPQRFIK